MNSGKIRGKVWKYGDNVNTDVIFPGRYLHLVDPREMAKHAMEHLDPNFVKNMKKGDVIVAGRNFGCGSSREQAAICLKYAGISAIVAESFARIFYRNAINSGLPILVCSVLPDKVEQGQILEIDFEAGEIYTGKEKIRVPGLPEHIMQIIKDGGIIPHIRKQRG